MRHLKGMMTAAMLALTTVFAMSAAEQREPIITFHTTLYTEQGTDNAFHFYIGSTEDTVLEIETGFGLTDLEVSPAVYNPETGGIDATLFTGTVNEDGMVYIYGDASKIDYIDFEGCYISYIDFPELTNVDIINMSHNALQSLDLSHMKKLSAIYVSDNPFDVKPLVIGPDKPNLAILEIAEVMSLDQSFSLRDYPALQSFDAYACHTLRKLDPTGCPNIRRLTLDVTQVESIDTSKNPELLVLNVADTKITKIDVSKNTKLQQLYCGHSGSYHYGVKMPELDISNNPDLVYLYCQSNDLTSLDLSHNPRLNTINARGNNLTSIDFSHNPDMYSINIMENLMDFATLPEPKEEYYEYYYTQRPLAVDKSYAEGTVIDFSSKVLRAGTTTEMRLYALDPAKPSDPIELDESYYQYADGKVTLKKAYGDSLYVAFGNSMFPEAVLTTDLFKVKTAEDFDKPSATFSMNVSSSVSDISFKVGMAGATTANPTTFSVDFGDGKLVDFTATTDEIPATANVSGKRAGNGLVTIYMPEGCDMTALEVTDTRLTKVDLSASASLRLLRLNNCYLGSIDLTYCRSLAMLDLDGNNLAKLDLTPLNGQYFKTSLTDLSAADNRLTSLVMPDESTFLTLDFSNNRLTEMPLDRATRLVSLNVSGNDLGDIDLEDCEALTTLDASNNRLTTLRIPSYTPLNNVNIAGNKFTFANLPEVGTFATYTYAPQQEIALPSMAPTANLSAEYFVKDGKATQYKWYKADGTPLTDAQVSGSEGRFKFTDANAGLVYCTMSHPLFPDFTGANILRTTNVQTAEMPSHVFTTFTTAEDGEGSIILTAATDNATVYIDWEGKGAPEQYVLGTTYREFPVKYYADTEVKAYSYDENDGVTVFTLNAGRLNKLDASPMKGLTLFALSGSLLTADKLILPQSPALSELRIDGADISTPIFSQYNDLTSLTLNNCKFETLDVTGLRKLEGLYVSNNSLSSVKLDNPALWELALVNNNLSSIDLSKVPSMEQLFLSHNHLSTLDVSALPNLHWLAIDNNEFTFATLPRKTEKMAGYNYQSQALVPITVANGKVDLSSQAKVGDTETSFRWFINSPYLDEQGELVGEELIPWREFDVKNGVTTFWTTFDNVMCVMTNEEFPDFFLLTTFIDVTEDGIDGIEAGNGVKVTTGASSIDVTAPAATTVSLYNMEGMTLGRKATTTDGAVRFDSLAPGIYVVVAGQQAYKVAVK